MPHIAMCAVQPTLMESVILVGNFHMQESLSEKRGFTSTIFEKRCWRDNQLHSSLCFSSVYLLLEKVHRLLAVSNFWFRAIRLAILTSIFQRNFLNTSKIAIQLR